MYRAGAEHREQDERDPDPAGERQVQRRRGADRDDDRDDELCDGCPEVAAGGIEAERPALLPLRVEVGDVRHRAGEVAAAEAGEGRRERAARRTASRGSTRRRPARSSGRSSRPAEMIVQLRPPNFGTRNEYGMRRVAPTRLGMEMSQKISPVLRSKPAAGSVTATIDQSCQTTKPRNSAKIDQRRLRRAMARPLGLPLLLVLGVPVVDPAARASWRARARRSRGRAAVRRAGERCSRSRSSVPPGVSVTGWSS